MTDRSARRGPSPGTFDAVTLDVGGVFVVPSHDRLRAALGSLSDELLTEHLWDAHYLAMHAVDEARSPAETFGTYVPALCHHLGFRDDRHDAAVAALEPLFGPSGLWHEPIVESIESLAALAATGLPLAIVSNADGTVDEILRDVGVCQVGPGPAVEVRTIVDSGALGIAKPDPRIFSPAIEALGSLPERTVHVGDSVHYDVDGAASAGLVPVHFDPRRLCTSDRHLHIGSLLELIG